jgi:hypothetical protein
MLDGAIAMTCIAREQEPPGLSSFLRRETLQLSTMLKQRRPKTLHRRSDCESQVSTIA